MKQYFIPPLNFCLLLLLLVSGCQKTDVLIESNSFNISDRLAWSAPTPIVSSCIPAPLGMTGWWPGDGNTNDIKGNMNANLNFDATYGNGLVGQAFILDGEGDFVDVPDHSSLNAGTGDFTVDMWVYFNHTNGEQVIAEKYVEDFSSIAPSGWTFTKLPGNAFYFGSGDEHGATSVEISIPVQTWIHFAIRRINAVNTIFMNGVQIAEGPFPNDVNTTSSLKFGHRGNPDDTEGSLDEGGYFLNGRIDEVEVFIGKALTGEEIASIYNAGSAGKCKPGSSPVVITSVTANPLTLWPANHKMKEVKVSAVTSGGSGSVDCRITKVTSSEPQSGSGKDDISPDWQIIGKDKLLLRAERNGKGNGRTYTVMVTCTDEDGNSATKTVQVNVPHDQGR